MRSSPRARAAFLLLYGAFLAWQVDRWCFTPHGLASTWADRHAGLTASAGSPRGLSQTFVMGADGLDGLWLRPAAHGRPAGDLVVDVSEVRGDARIRVERVVVPAADAIRSSSLHVPLRPQRRSRGQALQVDLRHVRAGEGPALDFAVTRENRLTGGRFFADGVEQWGDLVFETSARRATLPYWIDDILGPWPAWMRAWPTVVGVVLLANVILAWACAMAVGRADAGATAGRRAPPVLVPGVALRRTAIAATTVLVVAGMVIAVWPRPPQRSLDLLDALPDARIETTWPSIHQGVSREPVVFDTIRDGVLAMPTTRIAWTVDVPPGAMLRLGAAMRPDMWYRHGDGIQMGITVEHARGRTLMAHLTLFPVGIPEHRKLFPVEVPLHPWAGQRVTVVFESTPERWGNAVNDVPVWIEPRIDWPHVPGSRGAQVVRR